MFRQFTHVESEKSEQKLDEEETLQEEEPDEDEEEEEEEEEPEEDEEEEDEEDEEEEDEEKEDKKKGGLDKLYLPETIAGEQPFQKIHLNIKLPKLRHRDKDLYTAEGIAGE